MFSKILFIPTKENFYFTTFVIEIIRSMGIEEWIKPKNQTTKKL